MGVDYLIAVAFKMVLRPNDYGTLRGNRVWLNGSWIKICYTYPICSFTYGHFCLRILFDFWDKKKVEIKIL